MSKNLSKKEVWISTAQLGSGIKKSLIKNIHFEYRHIKDLKPHENIINKNLNGIIDYTVRNRQIPFPILIDRHTGVILDGHHRFNALEILKWDLVQCYTVNYLSEKNIQVKSGVTGMNITKLDVIKAGMAGKLFSPKSTRHFCKINHQIFSDRISEMNSLQFSGNQKKSLF